MSVSVLIEGAAQTIGECPYWLPDRRSLLFTDNDVGVCVWDSTTGGVSKVNVDGKIGFVAPYRRDEYVLGVNKNICILDWNTQKVTPLAEVDAGKPTKLNDGKCDANGRIWAGTMGFFSKTPMEDPPSSRGNGSLYSLDKDRTVKQHVANMSLSNGLDWSVDNRTFYLADTIPGSVTAYDFDLAAGTVGNPRVILESRQDNASEVGRPDGLTVDTEDKIWLACLDVGRIIRLDPETGKILRTVEIPAIKPTSCCFGGENLEDLYVTSGRSIVTDEQLKAYPLSGSVFKVTGLGVKGKLSYNFAG